MFQILLFCHYVTETLVLGGTKSSGGKAFPKIDIIMPAGILEWDLSKKHICGIKYINNF